jgi:transmembrane sensor
MNSTSAPCDPSHLAPDRVEDEAADWLARREAGLTAEEQAAFSQWLLANPRHADAAKRLELAWRLMRRPRFSGQADAVLEAIAVKVARRKRFQHRLWTAGGGLAVAAALALAFLPGAPAPEAARTAALPASVSNQPERHTLADGSVVELNAGGEIAVAFTPGRRDVRLVRGRAHFTVTKDPARPFVVTAGAVSVRAVGTAFAVRFEPEQVGVAVTEGRVAVESTVAQTAVPIYLGAGHGISVPVPARPGQVSESAGQPGEPPTAQAWTGLRLEFTDTPLSEAVELFNGQNQVQLALGDAQLADLRISGIFRADDPEGFSRLLEDSAGLRVNRLADGRIELGPVTPLR